MANPRPYTTAADRDMLLRIAAQDVTWRADIASRISYRLWSDEHTYTTCTPRLRRLDERGLILREHAAGYQYGSARKGPVELSDAGRDLLRRMGGES